MRLQGNLERKCVVNRLGSFAYFLLMCAKVLLAKIRV